MGSMRHYGIYSQSMVTLNSMARKSGFADVLRPIWIDLMVWAQRIFMLSIPVPAPYPGCWVLITCYWIDELTMVVSTAWQFKPSQEVPHVRLQAIGKEDGGTFRSEPCGLNHVVNSGLCNHCEVFNASTQMEVFELNGICKVWVCESSWGVGPWLFQGRPFFQACKDLMSWWGDLLCNELTRRSKSSINELHLSSQLSIMHD